ncbi:MAG: hypothetical protein E6Q97_22640 [Desulfurellales bacterium]|nr:MAG: hypothetical protein E6Q97_22640 [Desulfurellales bacterium]
MIRRSEIADAETPRTKRDSLDLHDLHCTSTVTRQQHFAGTDGAGEALYETEITDVTLLSLTLRFGTHPVDDAVLLMPSELTEDRRAAIEEQVRRAIERGM